MFLIFLLYMFLKSLLYVVIVIVDMRVGLDVILRCEVLLKYCVNFISIECFIK